MDESDVPNFGLLGMSDDPADVNEREIKDDRTNREVNEEEIKNE